MSATLPDPNDIVATRQAAQADLTGQDQGVAAQAFGEAKARAEMLGLNVTAPIDVVSVPQLVTPQKQGDPRLFPILLAVAAAGAIGLYFWKGKKWLM